MTTHAPDYFTIRMLGPADASVFHALRLDSLRLHPEAFGADPEDEAALSPAGIAQLLAPPPPGAVFGAYLDSRLVGIAGLHVESAVKRRHVGLVWGLHVAPVSRGHGAGRALLRAVEAHAREAGLERLCLAVGTGNAAARALYDAAGYAVYGIERAALKLGPGAYVDEELRVLDLRPSG
ncbi:MAG: GNAT family N-acetyltransferase [Acetobacteraceae bacterium]|nr:GNAT family N-acetyltransferase [Acetobacteraceae bacterium]